ncbi:Tetrapyrrole biosynthesis hydroxymethylbilane synthase [Penicillium cf. griseofulvum]|uniref:hydroxymethylbilane synthase n=1 Tax=Penicillium cf. griseofulvum TaxID=2972120 RepID=A0A9W9IQC8_9EURO|nr:Tetrapyrrole biosynthesis hydroxymethylbilane synthase [Penicillium cf. griseofulvum]KAJ5442871.1 Tetrapyrrole biosynthesis hydroxymethylbilane synthase [Penicillium cf. griseofulvum]
MSSHNSSNVLIGCRKSELALTQARSIISQLSQTLDPSPTFEIVTASVVGDADKQSPFALLSKQTGGSDVGKSLWTNGLEMELVAGKVQFLVHCLKDMPTTLPPNCLLGAIPEREDCSDAVVMKSDSVFKSIDQLPPGSVVGSSSSRRRALVRRNWPHLEVVECRGNIDTRLAKLDAPSSPFSCILLATAGLLRLGLDHRITQRLEPTIFPYAVGQGALGIEVSTDIDRQDILQLVQHVDHKPSRWRGMAERAMLRSLQGGCSSSIGVSSSFEPLQQGDSADTPQGGSDSGTLRLRATVIHIEGSSEISSEDVGTVQCDEEAEKLGVSVANMLLEKGVRDLLPQQS